jgi:hypothetical protein
MDQEARIKLALEAIHSKSVSSIRHAATLFEIPRSTLQSRVHGTTSVRKAHERQQRLTTAEEASLVKTVNLMHGWGWPMTIKAVEAFATELLQRRGDQKALGQCWYSNFLARREDLKVSKTRTLDQNRRDATHPEVLQGWFSLFSNVVSTYGIPEADWYNMDEKGFMKGVGDASKIIISKEESHAYINQPGNREWVSVIESINTTEYSLPPFVIFKGKTIQRSWADALIDKQTVIRVSDNGWTDHSIALDWLEHFNEHTKDRMQGKYRLLILDGHSSHVSFEFVAFCNENDIILLCLPPHSTHVLQPLDVGIFSPLAKAYKILVQESAVFGATYVDNTTFLRTFQEARKTIPKNIPGAWRGAGLVPYNPEKILASFRPKTPPFVSLTDENGRRVDIQVGDDLAQRINAIVSEVAAVCSTPLRSQVTFVQDTCLTALADSRSLQILNEELVKKQQERRIKKNNKAFGKARLLKMEDMLAQEKERKTKESEEAIAKARRKALYGVIGFVKSMRRELPRDTDLFD